MGNWRERCAILQRKGEGLSFVAMSEVRSRSQDAEFAAEAAAEAAAGGVGKRGYVRQIFSEIAPSYDLLNHLLSFNVDRRWRALALRELGWQQHPEGIYLDLCAGTLDVSAALCKAPAFCGSVVAVDFAEPMLRAGAWKVQGLMVHPVAGDALALPVRGDSISGAVVAFGARNLADLPAGLAEVYRLLRRGGRFVILDFSTPRSALVRFIYLAYFNRLLPFIGGLISGHRSAYRYLPASVANFPVREQLAALMQEAGFRDVRWRSLSLGIAAIYVGEKS
jgi:demethylmenaquinone methyltransferase/2-methoxy-6-polyprenyl-1,4-benzoquinol methylase